jgi:hypothetical protein
MNYLIIIMILIIAIICVMLIIKYFDNYNDNYITVESFDDFSPYSGNQAYPFVYEKQNDQKMLKQTLKKWEDPFNANDEGYYNAEPTGDPPLVPIYSYDDMEDMRFREYS